MVSSLRETGLPRPSLSGMDTHSWVHSYYNTLKAEALRENVRYRDWGRAKEQGQRVMPLVNPNEARMGYMRRMYMRATLILVVFYPVLWLSLVGLYQYFTTGSSLLHPALNFVLLLWGGGTVTVSGFAMVYAFAHIRRLRRDVG